MAFVCETHRTRALAALWRLLVHINEFLSRCPIRRCFLSLKTHRGHDSSYGPVRIALML